MIRAWHRKDHRDGNVIVVARNYVASQLCRELALDRSEAERHLVSAAETGTPIELEHAAYFFGEPG